MILIIYIYIYINILSWNIIEKPHLATWGHGENPSMLYTIMMIDEDIET